MCVHNSAYAFLAIGLRCYVHVCVYECTLLTFVWLLYYSLCVCVCRCVCAYSTFVWLSYSSVDSVCLQMCTCAFVSCGSTYEYVCTSSRCLCETYVRLCVHVCVCVCVCCMCMCMCVLNLLLCGYHILWSLCVLANVYVCICSL